MVSHYLVSGLLAILCVSPGTKQLKQLQEHLHKLSKSQLLSRIAAVLATELSIKKRQGPESDWEHAKRIGESLFRWAQDGFPRAHAVNKCCSGLSAVLAEYLCPAGANSQKRPIEVWTLFATINLVLGLWDIHRICYASGQNNKKASKKSRRYYVYARMFAPAIQRYLLTGRMSRSWVAYISRLWMVTWCMSAKDAAKRYSCVYITVCRASSVWYVGKARAARFAKKLVWPGWVSRFCEHCGNTCIRTSPAGHRDRYVDWRRYPIHTLALFRRHLTHSLPVELLSSSDLIIGTCSQVFLLLGEDSSPTEQHGTNTSTIWQFLVQGFDRSFRSPKVVIRQSRNLHGDPTHMNQ